METDHRAVVLANRKGGVGKTALSINIAERLAARDHRVLLVDADPAGHATEGLGLIDAYKEEPHIGQVLHGEEGVTANGVICETEWFDVVPSHEDLGNYQQTIDNEDRFAVLCLEENIVEPLLEDAYDYIIFDSPASAEALFSDAALVAAGNVMIPLLPGEESIRGFERMLTKQIAPIRENREVNILALIPNRCRSDNELKRLIEQLNEHFPEYLPSFAREEMIDTSPGPGIRERIQIKRAWRNGQPLSAYDPDNDMLDRLDELAAIIEQGEIEDGVSAEGIANV